MSEEFYLGVCIGLILGFAMFGAIHHQYRKMLVAKAEDGTAEKLPDGRFYNIVKEGKWRPWCDE